jgi:hypothetical protein
MHTILRHFAASSYNAIPTTLPQRVD